MALYDDDADDDDVAAAADDDDGLGSSLVVSQCSG